MAEQQTINKVNGVNVDGLRGYAALRPRLLSEERPVREDRRDGDERQTKPLLGGEGFRKQGLD